MDRKTIKPIVLSALSALAFGAVGTASTFALFTDKAETSVQVQAGKVQVESSITIKRVWEYNGSAAGLEVLDGNSDGTFVNSIGGTSSVASDGKSLTLSKWAPGDKAEIEIRNLNFSDVRTKLRFVETHTSTPNKDLYDALVLSYRAYDKNNVDITHKFMEWNLTEASSDLTNGELISRVVLTISFPNHGTEITERTEGTDNHYQDFDCTLKFNLEAVQGNAAVASLIDQLNADLAEEAHDTMYDALDEVKDIAPKSAIKALGYVWNSVEDKFYYPEEATANMYRFFKMYDQMPASPTYSVYADGWNVSGNDGIIALNGIGFDAGTSSGITSVSYVDTVDSVGRTNYIRTNSALTAVTIDAEHDTVHHYGQAGSLNIIAVAGSSYHEHGQVAFAEISKGRIALEKEAEVTQIHVNSIKDINGDTTNVFDEIIIAKAPEILELPKLSRDDVDIAAAGTLVVAIQNDIEDVTDLDYVWLTKQGIFEQIAVSDNKNSAVSAQQEQPTYADEVQSDNTKTAAQQIANNIGRDAQGNIDAQVTVGTDTFDVALDEDRNIILVDDKTAAEPATVYTVTSDTQGNTVVKDAQDQAVDAEVATAVSTAVAAEVEKTGLDEEAKEEAKTEIVDVVVSDEMAKNYVARVGTVGYDDLKVAIAASQVGDTVHLLQDTVLSSAIGNFTDRNLNGNGNRVTFANGIQPFGTIRDAVIENIEFEWYMAADYILTDYFRSSTLKNVSLFGSGTVNGNCGTVAWRVYGNSTLDGVKNYCDMTGDGAASNYNSTFFGIMEHNAVVTIRNSSFEGALKCGSAAMFVANPMYRENVTLNIQNVKNNGIIHSTCSNSNDYFTFNQIAAVTADGTFNGCTINVDGQTMNGLDVTTTHIDSIDGTGSFLFGPDDATLAIAKGEDLSLTVTKASMEGVHHYMVTVGCYVSVPTGSNRNYVHEIIVPEGEGNTFVAQTKYYGFVDYAWVENNPSAVEGTLNGETTYTLGNNTYYLVSEERHSTKGQPNAVEICSVSAFDADGKLLCSASLVNN